MNDKSVYYEYKDWSIQLYNAKGEKCGEWIGLNIYHNHHWLGKPMTREYLRYHARLEEMVCHLCGVPMGEDIANRLVAVNKMFR